MHSFGEASVSYFGSYSAAAKSHQYINHMSHCTDHTLGPHHKHRALQIVEVNRMKACIDLLKQWLLAQWHMTWTNLSMLLLEWQIASCWYKGRSICQFQIHFVIEMGM